MSLALIFDCETSGLPAKGMTPEHPNYPWVTQLAAVLCDEQRIYNQLCLLIRPDGRQIELEASALTGITVEMCENAGVYEGYAFQMLCAFGQHASRMVAHNFNFDMNMLEAIARRHDLRWPAFSHLHYTCTMLAGTDLCAIPSRNGRPGYKWPKLEELHQFLFQEEMTGAHDALQDVLATRRCYYELCRRGVIQSEVPA